MQNFHLLYLKNIEKELSSRMVDTSKLIYMDLGSLLSQDSGDLLSPEASLQGSANKVYSTYRLLDGVVARNYDRVEAVHLYYTGSGSLISSAGFGSSAENLPWGGGKAWLAALRASGGRAAWMAYERPPYYGVPSMTLLRSLRCYPILSDQDSCSIVVCVDFRVDELRRLMARLLPADAGETGLMRNDGAQSIGPAPGKEWDAEAGRALARVIEARGPQGSSSEVRFGGQAWLLTAIPLSDSGWDLVNIVPLANLYRKGAAIFFVILAICVASIGLGALAASFAASGIYNPLARLLGRFRSMPGVEMPEPSARTDEYRVLDDALSGISTRMSELETTVDANRPIIRHELFLRLLSGERMDAEEARVAFELAGASSPPPSMRACIVMVEATLEGRGGEGAEWVKEAGGVLKYRMADELAAVSPPVVLASPLARERLGFLVASEGGDEAELAALVAGAAARAGANARFVAGPALEGLGSISESFSAALELADYLFLFPELDRLCDGAELLARKGGSALPYREFPEDLAACLEARDLQRFRSLLAAYRSSAREGDCRARDCRAELGRLGLIVSEYANRVLPQDYPELKRNLAELLSESPSIDAFLGELSGVAEGICAGVEDPQSQRGAFLVAGVKAYVAAHLGEELSLERVGEAVAASPGYLGKVFRQETGLGFVSYLNEARLSEAARLIVETREPVQEIARRVGFNTPAYFIKLFKGRYGLTPLDFRRARAQPGQ
jgi:AraC-like DNA-binding protein